MMINREAAGIVAEKKKRKIVELVLSFSFSCFFITIIIIIRTKQEKNGGETDRRMRFPILIINSLEYERV